MSVDTLDGIEDGTDLALVTVNGVERWVFHPDGLTNRAGDSVPLWFFSGALAQGKVMLGNFAPPSVGEWFFRGHTEHLVLTVSDTTTAHCARFVGGRFNTFVELPNIVDTHQRTDRPDWVSDQFVQMATLAYSWHQQVVQLNNQSQHRQVATNNLRYARDYLNTAWELLQQ